MILYEMDGESHTVSEWCRIRKVPEGRVRKRLEIGVPLPIALSKKRLPTRDKSPLLTLDGETHTMREWMAIRGLSYNVVYSRMRRGMPVEQVLSEKRLPVSPSNAWKPSLYLTKDGRKATVNEWAQETGIPANTIYQRLHRKGDCSAIDYILNKGRITRAKKYAAHGRELTLKEWMAELGCSCNTLRRRLSRGWPLDRVFSPPMNSGWPKKTYTWGGKTMVRKEWAEYLGISVHEIRRRERVSSDPAYILAPRQRAGYVKGRKGKQSRNVKGKGRAR